MCSTAFLYSEKYFDYCPEEQHPYWNRSRFKIVFELVKSLGLLEDNQPSKQQKSLLIHEPQAASREELMTFHSPEYISRLEELGKTGTGGDRSHGLGFGDNPIFKGVHEASSLIAGGSIELVDLVHQKKVDHGFAFLGGLHHAHESKASGFCYYNDAVLAIKRMQKLGYKKILYIDTDAHHGDGTQLAFYDNPDVLTISLHESGRFLFPGTGEIYETGIEEGEGYSINLPFLPFTTDDLWLKAFESIVLPVWESFNPDFVYWQCGSDVHFRDPLTRLQLTNNLSKTVASKIHGLTHELSDGRIVIGGGGGYNPVETAKAWIIILAEFAELDLPDEVPSRWQEYCKELENLEIDEKFMNQQVSLDEENQVHFEKYISMLISELKKLVFPTHGLGV